MRDAAAKGRNGDALLVHVSPEEWALGASAAGDDFSINPDTGLAEHFSFSKILKGVAKAAAALVGGEFGGPAGAAAGGLIASKALGDDWQTAISTGALSGLGAWGVQQTGVADGFGGGMDSGADLLGQQGGNANLTGIAKYAVPALAGVIGLGGLGGDQTPTAPTTTQPSNDPNDPNNKPFDWQPPLNRTQYSYPGDFSTYGQTGGEHQWFDDVNPQPMSGYALGGPVDWSRARHMRVGGSMGSGADGGDSNDRTGQDAADHNGRAGYSGGNSGNGGTERTVAGPSTAPMGNSTVADRQIMNQYEADPAEGIKTDKDFERAISNLGQRANDYMDRGNSTLDDIGNAIAGVFGVGEMDPTKQALGASINSPDASWGFDPISLGATIAGTVLGAPIGSLYKGIKKVTGYPGPQIAFDGNQYGNYGFNSSPIAQGLGVMSADDMANAIANGGTGASLGSPGGSPAHLGNDQNHGEVALPTGLGALVSNGGTGAGAGNDGTTPPASAGEDQSQVVRGYLPFTGDYSTYGQGPEFQFYNPVNYPMAPVTLASGGMVSGIGDGQTDTIPAMLASGEHVIDAATVAALGNGNNAEGQRVLQAMKTKVRRKMGLRNPSRPPRKVDLSAMAA